MENQLRPMPLVGLTTPLAVCLGVNEIGSAIAVELCRARWGAVLAHDAGPPVLKRGMAFHDVLFDETVTIDGTTGLCVESGAALLACLGTPGTVAVTRLGLLELMAFRRIDVLVDARGLLTTDKPDLRHLARVAIGVGPGFARDVNCNVAIPTLARSRGMREGVKSWRSGMWRSALRLGAQIVPGAILGGVDGAAVVAPIGGIVVGFARDGQKVAADDEIVLIEPKSRSIRWRGVDPVGRALGRAVLRELSSSFL